MKVRAELNFELIEHLFLSDFDDEKYIIGCGFIHDNTIIVLDNGDQFPIKKDTRSISFDDIVDSNGNKIFASLQEDGKGGDIMQNDEYYGIAKYKDSRFVVEYENVEECLFEGNFEVIGIQE